jgi:hypothetical protein
MCSLSSVSCLNKLIEPKVDLWEPQMIAVSQKYRKSAWACHGLKVGCLGDQALSLQDQC